MEDQRQKKVQFIEDYIGEGNIGEGEDYEGGRSKWEIKF